MHAMDDSDDKPTSATQVNTIQEAVQLSLKDGLTDNCLFNFARALLAFEVTNKIKLKPPEVKNAFALWWSTAKPLLPADVNFDEWRYEFEAARKAARCPIGANVIAEAIRRADTEPLPPREAERSSSPKISRLLAVCYYLQLLAGNSPFFISVGTTTKILGAKSKFVGAAMLNGLVQDSILSVTQKGKKGCRYATRFRYNFLPHVES